MSNKRRRSLFQRAQKDTSTDEDDFSMEWLPDDEEAKELDQLRESEAVRPLNITPEEERFPPLQVTPVPITNSTFYKDADTHEPPPVVYEPIKWGSNLLALLFLVATMGLILALYLVWQDPYSQLNPFPPPTRYIEITATPEAAQPATATAAPTVEIVQSAFAFSLAGDVIYTTNGNDNGCDWTSIVGTVQTASGEAVDGYRVTIDDGTNEQAVFTGSAPRLGPGGWELVLGETLINSQYAVQLTDARGEAMSEPLLVDMTGDCVRNVAIISWQENSES